jgi:hypothetical protein
MENIPTQNNNPGDLKYVGQQNSTPTQGGFAKFDNPQNGYGALLNQVQGYITKDPNYTLADFSNKWAPPSDNNDTAQYTANLANKLGVSPDTQIGTLEPQIGKFADAIASNEGYQGTHDTSSNENTSTSEPNFWDTVKGGIAGLASNVVPYATSHLGAIGGTATGLGLMGAGILGAPESGGLSLGLDVAGATELANSVGGLFSGGGNSGTPTSGQTGSEGINSQNPENSSSVVSGLLGNNMIQSNKNSQKVADSYLQALSATPTGSVKAQNPNYQQGSQTLGMFGIPMGQTVGGRNDTTEGQKQVENLTKGLDTDINSHEAESGAQGDYEDTIREAKEANHKYLPETQWEEADKAVDSTMSTYQNNDKTSGGNGKTASTARFHQIKKELGRGRKFDPSETNAKRKAMEHLSNAAKKQVIKNSNNPELYKAVLKMEQNLIHGKEILKRIDGKKAPAHNNLRKTFLKAGGNALAAYLGNKIGGPIGAVISYMVEKNVVNAVDKRYGKTIFNTPAMKKSLSKLKNTSPEAYSLLKEKMKKLGISEDSMSSSLSVSKTSPGTISPNHTNQPKNTKHEKKRGKNKNQSKTNSH